jgi:hypothetical protein
MQKIIELIKTIVAVIAQTSSSAATLYNGVSSGGTNGLDTREQDELVIVANIGTIATSGTLDLTLVESATNDSSTATAITGAVFTQFTPANDNAQYCGSVKCKNYKRYIWVKSVQTAHAIVFGVSAVMGHSNRLPNANSPVFDLNHA